MTRIGYNPFRRLAIVAALVACCIGVANAEPPTPHPAVARIVVQEADGIAYGSGTLIDVREQYGLVTTNWHVVRDASGKIEVRFPNGFRSEARALKIDEDWDLAALVIWRPPIEPAVIAPHAPCPGEPLTICGYGQGQYRAVTGRCTEYYAPKIGLPHELVELNVEARQGDSGGPIFNSQGELAGVLFGAGQGTTMGAFGGRVNRFLSTLAADIGQRPNRGGARISPTTPEPPAASTPTLVAVAPRPETQPRSSEVKATPPPATEQPTTTPPAEAPAWSSIGAPQEPLASDKVFASWGANTTPTEGLATAETPQASPYAPSPATASWFEDVKSLFALIGVFAVLLAVVKAIT